MKNAAILGYLAAAAAVASAQVTLNDDGTYTCKTPGAAYCAGDSLKTDIIIRCSGTVGQPGRCSNNLAGQEPIGNHPSLCWQSSVTSGDAACEKNCVVYGSSGNFNGTFTLPASVCTPTYTATSSTAEPTTTITYINPTQPHHDPTTTVTYVNPTQPPHGGNATVTYLTTTGHTATPVGPSGSRTTVTPVPTAGAPSNRAAGALAIVGAVAAYLF
ncbi:hypothetical protein B0T25DRAFT_565112 [Lasiosphaeria hispida]|uniref:Uncharacterized protein n=1 Tax=Lasiosphaeria hispida TaxID=260671 RepID=A0AAJ0HRY7_9PEZI|nr:hypothetical protein B0T25DRAFT_565112 [Lasiosphaeria hispida]